MLGPEYAKVQLFVNPSDAGHDGVARPRTYIIYYNKVKLEYKFDAFELYHQISREIKKVVATKPRDYLVSLPSTRALDLLALARKRGVVFHEVPCLKITQNIMKHTFWEVDGNRMTSSCATMCYGYVPLGRLLALTRLVDPDLPRASMSLKSC